MGAHAGSPLLTQEGYAFNLRIRPLFFNIYETNSNPVRLILWDNSLSSPHHRGNGDIILDAHAELSRYPKRNCRAPHLHAEVGRWQAQRLSYATKTVGFQRWCVCCWRLGLPSAMLVVTVLNDYLHYLGWSHVRQVFRLQRIVHRKTTGRLSYEVVFGITNLTSQQATPDRLLEIMRQHWHIENRLHYVRDVTFQEDACRLRKPHLQHSLAILNNLALGLIRQFDRFPYVPQARRYLNAHPLEALQLIC